MDFGSPEIPRTGGDLPPQHAPSVLGSQQPQSTGLSVGDVPVVHASDPLNLRSVVDQLEPMIRARAAKGPVVVLIGETGHDKSQIVALSQAVMARLTEGPSPLKVAHAVEWPHNMYHEIMDKDFGRNLPPDVRAHIEAGATDSQRLIRAMQDTVIPHGAPAARRNVLAFADSRNIPVIPVDTAWRPDTPQQPGWQIDVTDPATRALVAKHARHVNAVGKMDSSTPEAIRLRNAMVVDRLQADIKKNGAQVYVLSYGAAHIAGWRKDPSKYDFPFSSSLARQFSHAGIDAMPIVPFSASPDGKPTLRPDMIPADATAAMRQGAVVTGFSPAAFANQKSDAPETAFLQELHQHNGDLVEVFPDHGIKVAYPSWTNVRGEGENPQTNKLKIIPPAIPQGRSRRDPALKTEQSGTTLHSGAKTTLPDPAKSRSHQLRSP